MWPFVAAAALQLGSGLLQAKQQGEALAYKAAEAERNRLSMLREAELEDQIASIYQGLAFIERGKGKAAREEAEAKAYLYGKETKRLLGQQVMKSARGGVRVGEGSALEAYADLAGRRAYEKSLITWQGDVSQWSYEGEAWHKEMEGAIHLDKAKVLRADAEMGATQADIYRSSIPWAQAGAILGGAGDALSTLNRSGMFDKKK